jgi:hypothetical protein
MGQLDFTLLQPFADGAANHFMRGGFPRGQMQRHPGTADSKLCEPGVLTTTSLSLLFSAKSVAFIPSSPQDGFAVAKLGPHRRSVGSYKAISTESSVHFRLGSDPHLAAKGTVSDRWRSCVLQ